MIIKVIVNRKKDGIEDWADKCISACVCRIWNTINLLPFVFTIQLRFKILYRCC